MRKFDYYIFIDFSENLIGYNIIGKNNVKKLLSKVSKLKHYRNLKHKREYLNSMKKLFKKEKINSFLLKMKIFNMRDNINLFSEVLEFIKKHTNCVIFISVDNRQFKAFKKLVSFVDGGKVFIKKESELVRGTPEYQVSLILDNLLNIERLRK